ncbi:NAD(P)-dependent oxidoreductase [Sphingomonas rhizophila]|uniref:NAD(P)-dependent oxidoreductase n=1 Tax=Sphingomonas rhizophila TaxID=2071607 RepID=A0A7G9SBU4_9SPHN|nr:NAD(P)-dependent oxidoreductase [Sphingomonas rhizophila]
MIPATVKRFVHISSFSVYDFRALGFGSTLDERSPPEARPEQRDAYTWTKIAQERLVADHCSERGLSLAVIRPGAIYGPGKDWDFGRALRIGPFDLILAPFSSMRLTHVENCAAAIVRALDAPIDGVFNIVDAQAPSYGAYHRHCRRAGAPAGFGIYVPWLLVALGGLSIRAVNRLFCKGRARLPELFDYPRQVARWKPLRYSNRRAREQLGWTPAVDLDAGIAGMIGIRQPDPAAITAAKTTTP